MNILLEEELQEAFKMADYFVNILKILDIF